MRDVNLPLPVAIAGGALLLLGGYIVGVALGPHGSPQGTATVESYDRRTDQLCLTGDDVKDLAAAEDDVLCGTWRNDSGGPRPRTGEEFRFVAVTSEGKKEGETATYIYGEVLPGSSVSTSSANSPR